LSSPALPSGSVGEMTWARARDGAGMETARARDRWHGRGRYGAGEGEAINGAGMEMAWARAWDRQRGQETAWVRDRRCRGETAWVRVKGAGEGEGAKRHTHRWGCRREHR